MAGHIKKTILKHKHESTIKEKNVAKRKCTRSKDESTPCSVNSSMKRSVKRKDNGVFAFNDHPKFQPNLSPKEVLQSGSFGGTYFRPIKSGVTKMSYGSEVWKELPEDWLKGLDITKQVASPNYDMNVNKYKVKCGGSLQMWEDSNWIRAQDPYGWFQWYCRFFQGRRSEDDGRQISRWLNCAGVNGRWRNNLIGKIYRARANYNDIQVSPVVRQVLLHWGYVLTEEDFKARVDKLKIQGKK